MLKDIIFYSHIFNPVKTGNCYDNIYNLLHISKLQKLSEIISFNYQAIRNSIIDHHSEPLAPLLVKLRDSEANASDFLKRLEVIFPLYFMQVLGGFNSSVT